MNRISMVKSNNLVCIDGICFTEIDMSSLPANLHAMQWYGSDGEEEYYDANTRRPYSENIVDLTKYSQIIAQWNAKKAELDVISSSE